MAWSGGGRRFHGSRSFSSCRVAPAAQLFSHTIMAHLSAYPKPGEQAMGHGLRTGCRRTRHGIIEPAQAAIRLGAAKGAQWTSAQA